MIDMSLRKFALFVVFLQCMKIILIFAKDKTFMVKARPFIKWVGGKTQLIEQLDAIEELTLSVLDVKK